MLRISYLFDPKVILENLLVLWLVFFVFVALFGYPLSFIMRRFLGLILEILLDQIAILILLMTL